MREIWVASGGVVLGWFERKAVHDPDCQLGLGIMLALMALMGWAFVIVAGRGGRRKQPVPPDDER